MTVIVRFAPSPTGLIHIGNARTALLNALYALQTGGRFLLRFDDTDTTRARRDYAGQIKDDLAWLGIEPDDIAYQSERLVRYADPVERLKSAGLLYPCYETPQELERKRRRQRAMGLAPVYDRQALELTTEDRAGLEAEGRKPHWRFKLPRREAPFTDLIRGPQRIELSHLSDPVLIRADGSYLYTLPSVVDDIDFGVTHIIRGEDHVTNSAVQIALFTALGHAPPAFAHHSLLTGGDGKGLSKRLGSVSIAALRKDGFEANALVSYGCLIGTSDALAPHDGLATLAQGFSFEKLSRAPARFDITALEGLNTRILHHMPYEAAAQRLRATDADGGEAFWVAVRGNLRLFHDARTWHDIIFGEIEPRPPADQDRDFLAQARALLPVDPFDQTTWRLWTTALKDHSGRTGKALFLPLRQALTGQTTGPEMALLLPLIGRERVLRRLGG